MKPHKAIAFLLVFPAAVLLQAKNKKPIVPAVFGQAQYVYVEAVDGRQFDPNLYPEDREAIADVQNALADWHRYVLVVDRGQADLVIVVRKGRAAAAGVGLSPHGVPDSGTVRIGSSGAQGSGQGSGQNRTGEPVAGQTGAPGIETTAEAGPAEDFFEVCQSNGNGGLSTPLWERSMADGLDAPRVPLFQQFREAVDKAYPVQPAQPKKP